MKPINFLMFTILIIGFSACQQEEILSTDKTTNHGEGIESRTPPEKVLVCHLVSPGVYELREVPLPSLTGHLNHGDFLPDADGDGYSVVGACVGSANDCDDNNANVNPGVTEICNGIDDDCDGLTDDEDDDPGYQLLWYIDSDGDGVGSAGVQTAACVAPVGFVSISGDCISLMSGMVGH